MSLYYKVQDVMELMECSDRTAYRIIQELNQELEAMGKLPGLAGKINKKYFHQRYDIEDIPPPVTLHKTNRKTLQATHNQTLTAGRR